jgi:hypothetical protein
MHFDQRTGAALREVGLDREALERASTLAAEATREAADDVEAFFDGRDSVHSDMDRAHGSGGVQRHDLDYVDCYTHAADLRGYVRFADWGVPIEDGRVLSESVVELTLGAPVDDRVRFAATADPL